MDGMYFLDDSDHVIKLVKMGGVWSYGGKNGCDDGSLYQIIWDPHFHNVVVDKTIYFGWEIEDKIKAGLLRPVTLIKHNMTRHSFS